MNQQNSVNDLFDYGKYIVQNDEYFKFSIDSVLLAEFVNVKKNDKYILDLCSGNAPVPMILSTIYGDSLDITGVELQKVIYDMGIESIKINDMNNIHFINQNIKDFTSNIKYDIITCNPPYFVTDEKLINNNIIKAIARHEIEIDLESIIKIAKMNIKNMGYFYLVHHPQRSADIISLLNKYNFGIKTIQPVYSNENKEATLVLIEAIYNGKNYVKIGKPVITNGLLSYKNIFRK